LTKTWHILITWLSCSSSPLMPSLGLTLPPLSTLHNFHPYHTTVTTLWRSLIWIKTCHLHRWQVPTCPRGLSGHVIKTAFSSPLRGTVKPPGASYLQLCILCVRLLPLCRAQLIKGYDPAVVFVFLAHGVWHRGVGTLCHWGLALHDLWVRNRVLDHYWVFAAARFGVDRRLVERKELFHIKTHMLTYTRATNKLFYIN